MEALRYFPSLKQVLSRHVSAIGGLCPVKPVKHVLKAHPPITPPPVRSLPVRDYGLTCVRDCGLTWVRDCGLTCACDCGL